MKDKIIFGVGYFGNGLRNTDNIKAYKCWYNMLMRCYDEISLVRNPTYIGCSVHPDWLNFQVFKEVKEGCIKELANKHKPNLTESCYQALMNYKVEIND